MSLQTDKVRGILVRDFVLEAPDYLRLRKVLKSLNDDTKIIRSDEVQKAGLLLTGHTVGLLNNCILVFGKSEAAYFDQLQSSERKIALEALKLIEIPVIIFADDIAPPEVILNYFNAEPVSFLVTPMSSWEATFQIGKFLNEKFAERKTVHGEMLGIFDTGVLLVGNSGIGKSQCALELVSAGHRLISDDSVEIRSISGEIEGRSPEITSNSLEIKGLGVVNIREAFGITAIGGPRKIDVCLELKRNEDVSNEDKVFPTASVENILGVEIPKYTLPVGKGQNLGTLVEVVVREHMLRKHGLDSTALLLEKHNLTISGNK